MKKIYDKQKVLKIGIQDALDMQDRFNGSETNTLFNSEGRKAYQAHLTTGVKIGLIRDNKKHDVGLHVFNDDADFVIWFGNLNNLKLVKNLVDLLVVEVESEIKKQG